MTDPATQRKARQRALDDFWYFHTKVVRNRWLEEKLHKPIHEWLQERGEKSKKMLLMSRGHIKSNIATVPYPLWRACRDPNIRVLLGSHKDDDALKFLLGIKQIITTNKTFQWLFPEIRKKIEGNRPVKWNQSKALIERDSQALENTFEIMSPKAPITGRHYMLGILDDLVTDRNVETEDQIEASAIFHRQFESLLDPGAEEIVLGTRYDYSDEYGRIIDDQEISQLYDIKVMPAHEPEIIHDFLPGGSRRDNWTRQDDLDHLIHPQRFTLDKKDHIDPQGREWLNRKSLPATRILQGSTVYATQYMLEPFDRANAMFREEDIKFVDQLPRGPLKWYRLCDLSSEKNTKDSFTAIITGCRDEYNQFYITDIFWGNFKPTAICQELIDGQNVAEERRPTRVSFEKGPYEKAIKPWLDREAAKQNTSVPVMPLPGAFTQKTKIARIDGLEPYIAAGTVYILKGCRFASKLIEELVKHPRFSRRDLADALAHMPVIVYPGREPQDNVAPKPEIDYKALSDKMLIRAVEDACRPAGALTPIGSGNVMTPAGRQAFQRVRFGRS